MPGLRRLIQEIHRRSLWQVLGIYAVASWVIWQVVVSLYEGVGLPDWVPATALVLLLVGLPIVLATAFVQEGAPGLGRDEAGSDIDGPEPENPSGPDPTPDAALTAAPATRDDGSSHREPSKSDSKSDSIFTWSRAITGGVLAFAVLGLAATGFMAMRTLGIGPAATLMSKGVIEARDPIVLADFDNATSDSTLDELTTEALRIDLSESETVSLLPEAAVYRALERMERDPGARLAEDVARELAVREGVKAVLVGRVRQAVGSYVLSARLIEPDSGAVLAAFRETAEDSTDLIGALDRLSGEIRTKVGESLKSVREAEPLQSVTTSSLEALRLYSQGDYDAAVTVDSAFAMAWRKIGINLANEGLARARQLEAFTRAYELRDRVGPRERGLAEGSYHMSVTGDYNAAVRAYERVLTSYPDDPIAHNNLAIVLENLGEYGQAEQHFREAYEITGSAFYLANAAWTRSFQGHLDEALALVDSLIRHNPWGALRTSARMLTKNGRYAESDSAAQRLRPLEEGPGAGWYSLWYQMYNDAARARLADAHEHAEARRELVRSVPFADFLRASRLELAAAQATWEAGIAGDAAAAERIVERVLDLVPMDSLPPLERPHGSLALVFALAGDAEQAERHLAAYDSVAPGHWANGASQFTPALQARAWMALERDQLAEARRHIRRGIEEDLGCQHCYHPLLGRAHELTGQPDSAIAAYEEFLEANYRPQMDYDALYRGWVLERLGGLHEQTGSRTDAARYYREFVDLWEDADPALQPRVDAARRALERLAAEGG